MAAWAGNRYLLWTSLGSLNQAEGEGTSKVCWLEAHQNPGSLAIVSQHHERQQQDSALLPWPLSGGWTSRCLH